MDTSSLQALHKTLNIAHLHFANPTVHQSYKKTELSTWSTGCHSQDKENYSPSHTSTENTTELSSLNPPWAGRHTILWNWQRPTLSACF